MSIPLSFSRIDDYLRCALKFSAKYVDKNYPQEKESAALKMGKDVHAQLENYVIAKLKDANLPNLNAIARSAAPIVHNILSNYHSVAPETQLAVNDKWQLTDWFAEDVMYRCVVDLMAFSGDDAAIVVDYKTGKVRPYEDGEYTQLKLTAAMLFSIYPQLEKIKTYYLFLEHKKTVSAEFIRADLESFQQSFSKLHTEINETEFWTPKVNEYCRYCLIRDRCELAR